VTPPTHQELLSVKRQPPAIAMTGEHYKHIQTLIKRELKGRIESSAWFALALAALSVAATVAVTVAATSIPEAANRAKIETLGWGSLAFGVFCLVVHLLFRRRSGDQRAKDIIDMMDRYNMAVEQHRVRSTSEHSTAASSRADESGLLEKPSVNR
jgi:hypothetical protein